MRRRKGASPAHGIGSHRRYDSNAGRTAGCGSSSFTSSGSPSGWPGILTRIGKHTFDPYPFAPMTMIVSLESMFLSLFILMSQNRTGLQADQRNHLELQINLLSEDENTKMLQMLRALCEHHKLNIANDPEIHAMTKRTEIQDVLSELQENLPAVE
jgi:uncharacterized membrane protein